MILSKLFLATHNKGKIAEMSAMLAPYGVEVVSAADLGLNAPEETEASFRGNALIKARYVAKETGLPALADDSGLCVAALNGAPGVYSADWAGPYKDFKMAMQRVIDEMGDAEDRSAYFTTVLALVLPDGSEQIFEGRCDGHIVWPARGEGGFGYDPLFVPDGDSRTFGEMSMDEKKVYSHRAKAVAAFLGSLAP